MNAKPQSRLSRRLSISGLLVLLGLAVQAPTLFWNHPLSFMTFLLVGGPLTLAGMLFYLYAIVSKE